MGQPVFQAEVVAVIGAVLRDEEDLPHTVITQIARLVDDRLNGPRNVCALDGRNRAECTGPTAAIRDFEIGTGAFHRDAQGVFLIAADGERITGDVIQRFGMFVLTQVRHQIENIHPTPRSDDAVQPIDLPGQLLSIALREAARRDEILLRPFLGSQCPQFLNALLPRGADEAAGIDDQHFGIGGVKALAQTTGGEHLRHRARIDFVFGATQVQNVVGIVLHRSIPINQKGVS